MAAPSDRSCHRHTSMRRREHRPVRPRRYKHSRCHCLSVSSSTTRRRIRPIGFKYFRSRATTSVCAPPGIVCTHNEVLPLRLEINAIFDPSGDHLADSSCQKRHTKSETRLRPPMASPRVDAKPDRDTMHTPCACHPAKIRTSLPVRLFVVNFVRFGAWFSFHPPESTRAVNVSTVRYKKNIGPSRVHTGLIS
jgi:hypothetical protein